MLAKVYEHKGDIDSAFRYQGQVIAIRDSIFNESNLGKLNNMNFEEKLLQRQRATDLAQHNLEQKRNLQYVGLFIVLIIILALFFALSKTIIVKKRFIEFFGVFVLLGIFEFVNLFMHIYLVEITDDSPVIMLILLMCVGSLLIPLHHHLQKWLIDKLVKKNNLLRLNNAKKVIEELE